MFLRFCSQNTHMIRDREAPVRMQGLHVGPRSARRRVGGSPWAFQMKRKLVSRCRRGQAQGCLPTAHQLQPEEEDFQSHTAGKQLTPHYRPYQSQHSSESSRKLFHNSYDD